MGGAFTRGGGLKILDVLRRGRTILDDFFLAGGFGTRLEGRLEILQLTYFHG